MTFREVAKAIASESASEADARVMRNFRKGEPDAKKFGYIIIPLAINPKAKPEEVIADNKEFETVWQVLNALRAHDERFNAEINSIAFRKCEEPKKTAAKQPTRHIGVYDSPFYDPELGNLDEATARELEQCSANSNIKRKLEQDRDYLRRIDELVYARMVEKVGSRLYWERWARDIAPVVANIIGRISELVAAPGLAAKGFEIFLKSLRLTINSSITPEQAIEMPGQHLITRPVFEALFADFAFGSQNGVTQAMNEMIAILDSYGFRKDTDVLARFHESVKVNLANVDTLPGRQTVIRNLYDSFFRGAFPKAVEQLGIVYTPVECPELVIHGAACGDYRVEKMKFGGKQGEWDKSRIVYNSQITIENIPLRAYEYVVNGRSAIEWIMESYRIRTGRDSGIVSDPNDWAREQ